MFIIRPYLALQIRRLKLGLRSSAFHNLRREHYEYDDNAISLSSTTKKIYKMNIFSLYCQIGQTKNTFTNLMTLIILMCFRILIIGAKDPDSGVERIRIMFKAPSTGLMINHFIFGYPNPARVRAFFKCIATHLCFCNQGIRNHTFTS